ncbi:hypothetical protein I7I53_08608 [Histoplasma capsulatum var. duboisii H88]|uniref:Uncharacterized protein n=1 Tax=Ajellomyces capsulatus (strain H88) TaxID=544711 RepID=A0A8A1LG38_AJEC8|nr:hypothetical protein I7I53_08608 [Histoplasma capsulatum var. duboisii H88]
MLFCVCVCVIATKGKSKIENQKPNPRKKILRDSKMNLIDLPATISDITPVYDVYFAVLKGYSCGACMSKYARRIQPAHCNGGTAPR